MLEPADDSDKAASDFIENAESDLHLNCDPYVYFRASILFFRHHAHDLGIQTEDEYLDSRNAVLDDLAGQPRPSQIAAAVFVEVILLGILWFVGTFDQASHKVVLAGAVVGGNIWIGFAWWSSHRYREWIRSLPAATRLDILDALRDEGTIDQVCHDKYADIITSA